MMLKQVQRLMLVYCCNSQELELILIFSANSNIVIKLQIFIGFFDRILKIIYDYKAGMQNMSFLDSFKHVEISKKNQRGFGLEQEIIMSIKGWLEVGCSDLYPSSAIQLNGLW